MRVKLCGLAVLALGLGLAAPPAEAHLPYKAPPNATLSEREKVQERNLAHARYVCRRGGGQHRTWACLARRWLARELAETRAALRPPIAHRQLWLCIHRGEAAWDNDGVDWRGYPSLYHGGLQMTLGWLGLVGNAAHLTPEQQMAAAEEGYRRSGYSHAWLRGQWPRSHRPCMHLA